mgnify:FL=1
MNSGRVRQWGKHEREAGMLKYDKSQQAVLDEFFKEETTWYIQQVLNNFLTALFIFISSGIMIIPHQVWNIAEDKAMLFIVYGLYLSAISVYGQTYTVYGESGEVKELYKVIRWLPVSACQFRLYRIRKCAKLCVKCTVAIMAIRAFIAVGFMHNFCIFDLIIPIVFNLVFPVLLSMVAVFLRER